MGCHSTDLFRAWTRLLSWWPGPGLSFHPTTTTTTLPHPTPALFSKFPGDLSRHPGAGNKEQLP